MHESFKYGTPSMKLYSKIKGSVIVPTYKSIKLSPNPYTKTVSSTSWEEDYEKLRFETLSFVEKPYSKETFQYLQRSIENKLVPLSYEYVNLLELVFFHRYFNSKKKEDVLSFGAKMSYELDNDQSLEINIVDGIDMPEVLNNGWKLDDMYINISQFLYKGKLYRIMCEPWVAYYKSRNILYEHTVLNIYNKHKEYFESKNVYISPNSHLDYKLDIDRMNHDILFEKIEQLSLGDSLLYLTTSQFGNHTVTCVIRIHKKLKYKLDAICYFVDSNLFDIRDNKKEIEQLIVQRLSRGRFYKINYTFRILFPSVALNSFVSSNNLMDFFLPEGYCATIAIIFSSFFLQFFLNSPHVHRFDVEKVTQQVYNVCIGMIATPVDKHNFWFFFVKNYVFKTFLEHYELDSKKPLSLQRGVFSDAWSDIAETGFPAGYDLQLIFQQDQSRFEKLNDKEKLQITRLDINTVAVNSDSLNSNYFRMLYLINKYRMVQMFFGIVLYDEHTDFSVTDTFSRLDVDNNNVKYYVLRMNHVNHLLYSGSGNYLPRYKNWKRFVEIGMALQFSSLSGKEILTLTKHGMIQQIFPSGVIQHFTRFHIFGIKEEVRNRTREHVADDTDVQFILGTTPNRVPLMEPTTTETEEDYSMDLTGADIDDAIDSFKKISVSDRSLDSHRKPVFRKTMHSKKQNPTHRRSLSGKFTRR